MENKALRVADIDVTIDDKKVVIRVKYSGDITEEEICKTGRRVIVENGFKYEELFPPFGPNCRSTKRFTEDIIEGKMRYYGAYVLIIDMFDKDLDEPLDYGPIECDNCHNIKYDCYYRVPGFKLKTCSVSCMAEILCSSSVRNLKVHLDSIQKITLKKRAQ